MFDRWLGGYAAAWQSASPDLRRFLVGVAAWSAYGSIFWVDFGPYLLAIGLTPAELGLVMAGVSLAGAVAAVPAGLVADVFGRRAALVAGQAITTLGLIGLVLAPGPAAVGLLAAAVGAGNTAYFVVGPPFLTENSEPHHRDRSFAAYFAIGQAVGAVAPIVLAAIGAALATAVGDSSVAGPYRVLVAMMAVLSAATLLFFATLHERPAAAREGISGRAFDPRSLLPTRQARRPFALILLLSGLIALGAGQLIPFLNVFVQRRFGLDVVALNAIFAISSLGTLAATLAQPWLAARLGRVHAIVVLQVASLPFIFVLGWGAWLAVVVVALVVRNTLMNAGNPLFQRFAMDQVPARDRARLSGAMQLLWSAAWVVGAIFYGAAQQALGFDAGYALDFAVTLVLYGLAALILWRTYAPQDRAGAQEPATTADTIARIPGRFP